jgi:hypothetical protein
MLLLVFALAGASVGPAPDLQRAKRVKVVRARVPARAAPGKMRIPVRAVSRDPNMRYRLTDLPSEKIDGKDLAVRDKGMACETTGAPVCPSNGIQVVKTPLTP